MASDPAPRTGNGAVSESLASRIRAANEVLLSHGDLEAIPEFFTQRYVAHLTEQTMEGQEAIRRFVAMLRGALSDIEVELEILIEGAERVAWQRTLRGTHVGDFMGFSASGRRLVWRDMVTSRFEDRLIAEQWAISDLAERMLRSG